MPSILKTKGRRVLRYFNNKCCLLNEGRSQTLTTSQYLLSTNCSTNKLNSFSLFSLCPYPARVCAAGLSIVRFNFLHFTNTKANFSVHIFFPSHKNYYSTNDGVVPAVKALRAYRNADLDKLQILKENQGKAGVYR